MFLTSLPNELILHISEFLEIADVRCMISTSRHWQILWQEILYSASLKRDNREPERRYRSLCLAAYHNQLVHFEALLERANVSVCDTIHSSIARAISLPRRCIHGNTLLDIVILLEKISLVRLLLERFPEMVNIRSGRKLHTKGFARYPLDRAVFVKNTRIIELLANTSILTASPQTLKTALTTALRSMNFSEIREFLRQDPPFPIPFDRHRLIVHVAGLDEKGELTKLLLGMGESIQCSLNRALEAAYFNYRLEAFMELAKAGARCSSKRIQRDVCSDIKYVRILVEVGADVRCLDSRKRTILHKRIVDVEVAQLLTEAAPHLPISKDKCGRFPLDALYTSRKPCEKLALFLIKAGGGVRSGYKKNKTEHPIHIAASHGHVAVVNALLQQDPSLANLRSEISGSMPIHLAATQRRSPKRELSGNGPVDHRVSTGNPTQDGISMTLALRDAGADLSAITPGGSTALQSAIAATNYKLAIHLIDLGVPPQEKLLHNHLTALHMAVMQGSFEVVQRLCVTKSQANERAAYGITPLHLAYFLIRSGIQNPTNRAKDQPMIINHLASSGADMHALDSLGRTPGEMLLDTRSKPNNSWKSFGTVFEVVVAGLDTRAYLKRDKEQEKPQKSPLKSSHNP